MESAIPIILCAFLIILSGKSEGKKDLRNWVFVFDLVQARYIESRHEDQISKESSDKYYSKLLAYLKTQEKNNDLSSDSTEDVRQLPKRGFFLFPTRRSSQRYRPIYSYGRKSHWDTFFG